MKCLTFALFTGTMVWMCGPGSQVIASADPLPSAGASTGTRTMPSISENNWQEGRKSHLSPVGKPCLVLYGMGQPQRGNKNIFEHTIFTRNTCREAIKAKVCYFRSSHCVLIETPAFGHNQTRLGIMSAMKEFRFEFNEQFDGIRR
jgi:hypothetical protein